MNYTTHAFSPDDIASVNELQQQYVAANPACIAVPAQFYLSPHFAGGQNVRCACDTAGRLIAFAPYFPQNELAWVEIRTLPGLSDAQEMKDMLFDWLLARARQCGQTYLNFQYFPSETESIQYAESKGATYAYSIFTMHRPLDTPLPHCPTLAGFTLRPTRMETEAELRSYLEARAAYLPESALTFEDWQYFAASPLWSHGVNMAAFDRDTLISSVLVFWEPGSTTGSTEYIFTSPAYRGKGLARALITEALRHLKEHGLTTAALEVKAHNESALSIYIGLGYHIVAESRVYQFSCLP